LLKNLSDKVYIKRLCAFFSGGLVPFAFSPFDFYFFSIFSLSILFYLWSKTKTARESFILGYLFGFAMFGVGVNWLHISIDLFGNMHLMFSLLITYLFIAFIALYPALCGYIAVKYFKSSLFVCMPILWVISEWLRGWIFTGFPWLNIGTSQTDSILINFAPIIGDYGISLIVCIISITILKIIFYKNRQRFISLFLLIIIFLSSLVLNKINWTKNNGETLNVALVQGAIPQEIKWQSDQDEKSYDIYMRLSEPFWSSDLIIWPETAISSKYHLANNFIEKIDRKQKNSNASFMTGIINEDTSTNAYFNSILLVDGNHHFYNKNHLVPFGEYLPLKEKLNRFFHFFNIPISNFSSGEFKLKNFKTNMGNFGMSICYEAAFGNQISRSLPEANVLINVSNDAWFGDSMAPHQHLQISRMRAIENGRYFLRATNNGISAIIDNRGKVISRSPQFKEHTLNSDVKLFIGATPYSKYGNTFLLLFCTLFLFINLILNRKFNKKVII
jgi:apolipoprotein N-acyltransferase